MVNSVEEVSPFCFPVSLFDKLLTSHRCVTENFILKSKHLCFIAIIKTEHILTYTVCSRIFEKSYSLAK
jgi:hypothetical protein